MVTLVICPFCGMNTLLDEEDVALGEIECPMCECTIRLDDKKTIVYTDDWDELDGEL
jgi:hypothetical protein